MIFIGFMTRQVLRQSLDGGDISNFEVKKFYKGVRQFYVKSVNYIIDTYPMTDEVLHHARFLNFDKRLSIGFDSIEFFVGRFPFLLPLAAPNEMEALQEEFVS